MRLSACMGTKLHIIEPCGFPWSIDKMRRAGMDYIDLATITRHADWQNFKDNCAKQRLILLTTRSAVSYLDFRYRPDDILLAGRESSGVPDSVHSVVDARILIPMHGTARSLNVINALAMTLGEAIRQNTLSA